MADFLTVAEAAVQGTCHALFAYDLGFSVDLDGAEQLLKASAARETMKRSHRSPRYFEYKPAPVRVTQQAQPIQIGALETAGSVESLLFDFGAVSVSYAIPLDCELPDLVTLSESLYENEALLADSRRRVEEILRAIEPSVIEPRVIDLVEDYTVYHLRGIEGGQEAAEWVLCNALAVAQVLRCDRSRLSQEEVSDALSCRASYLHDDLVLIDWNAAMLLLDDADDVRAVLEFANVELLEMRVLDDRLDAALDRAYEALARQRWWQALAIFRAWKELSRVGRLQADSALLFEGVNSALKLLGDQYLARVYRIASQRFHLPEWDASILRKLSAVESIYGKLGDRQATRRMELLEWIIILLFGLSIGLSLMHATP